MGSVILVPIVITVIIGPYLLPHSPLEMTIDFLQPPSGKHPFGTDSFGRDVLARVLRGGRASLGLGFLAMMTTGILGAIIGLVSIVSAKVDYVTMRFIDVLMAFPDLLLALGIMAILGQKAVNILIALTIVYTSRTARVVRSAALSIKEQDYVEAARALGIPTWRILVRHVLPNALPPLVVQGTFIFAWSILMEAGLSFIGIGIQPPAPSLGNIVSEARVIVREAPWLIFIPGSIIVLIVLAINLLGDGLREAVDPKMKIM
ncbi:MAG: ABC transporter permease [Candidatus Bipolaricaulia bacterium]